MDAAKPQDDSRVSEVLKKIERTRQARRHKFYLRDEKITLSHGSGGKVTHNLIEGVFAPAFSNPLLAACRRERYGSHVSRSASTRSVHDTGKSPRMARGRRQRRVGVVTQ